VLAFFQSFENYNTTLFTRGTDSTLTIFIASKVRTGLTPAVNALGVILIAVTVAGAIGYEILRRREAARAREATRRAQENALGDLRKA
jgi:spermidine/putrescine transport system permease protein